MPARAMGTRTIAAVLAAASIMCVWTGTSVGAETIGAGYSASTLAYSDGRTYRCPGWSGGAAGDGTLFIPCGQWIYELDSDGSYRRAIPVPPGTNASRDVAVTHTGSALYFTNGPLGGMDRPDPQANPGVGKVVRMVRDPAGNFVHDPAWSVGPFYLENGWWSARNLDVDHAGRVFVTTNAYVFAFDPHTAQRVAAFGSDDRYNGAQYLEGLEIAQGLAVTPDGRTVYVVEQKRNHVQRWTLDGAGAWRRSPDWVLGALGPASDCVSDSTFASPYDVALDGAGFLYVLDTSCRRVQKYDAASRAFAGSLWRNYPVGDGDYLSHGLAANWQGTVVLADQGRRYTTPSRGDRCAPDNDAPAFAKLRAPAVVGADRRLTLTVQATDRCSGPAELLVTGDGVAGSWTPYARTITVGLAGSSGPRILAVTVRDRYGRTASRQITTRLDTTLPVLAPRRRIAVAGARRSCRGTARAMLRGTGYRLVDACATYTGQVRAIRRTGSTLSVRIRLNPRIARKLYTGVRGPVDVWVTGSRRLGPAKPIRTGRTIVVTSGLAVHTRTRTVTGVPVYAWSGR